MIKYRDIALAGQEVVGMWMFIPEYWQDPQTQRRKHTAYCRVTSVSDTQIWGRVGLRWYRQVGKESHKAAEFFTHKEFLMMFKWENFPE